MASHSTSTPTQSQQETQQNSRQFGIAALIAITLVSGYIWLKPKAETPLEIRSGELAALTHQQAQQQMPLEAPHLTQTAKHSVPQHHQAETSAHSTIAPSLLNTDIDANLSFDDNGQLISDINLRRYFDYFLSSIGELSIEQIRAAIGADALARLSPADAARVQAILARYLDYLSASDQLTPSADLTGRLDQLQALRREILGDELAKAFFGEEEQYTTTVLAEQSILQDSSLSPSERQQALEQIHQELPQAQRQSRENAVAHHLAIEQQRQFEQLQASTQQRFEERSALYGEEAANRLAELDFQRQQWQQRVEQYRQQRQQVLARNLSSGEQNAALNELRQSLFDESEQRRVESLESDGFPNIVEG